MIGIHFLTDQTGIPFIIDPSVPEEVLEGDDGRTVSIGSAGMTAREILEYTVSDLKLKYAITDNGIVISTGK